jgi:hypothetical protein
MKLSEVFSSSLLKAEDLQGRTVRVTISKAEIKQFDDGNKIILSFQGKEKSLVCNRTNSSIIAENLGSQETSDWVGQTILLTVKKVEFQGKLVPAIRVVLNESTPPPTAKNARPEPGPAQAQEGRLPDAGEDCPF